MEMAITSEEFERIKQAPRSKWSECIQHLLRAKDGEVYSQKLSAEDNNPHGRQSARKAIAALAHHYGLKVSCVWDGRVFHVQRLEKTEQMQ
jgi:hypothetical protein